MDVGKSAPTSDGSIWHSAAGDEFLSEPLAGETSAAHASYRLGAANDG
jgi:hypothetical protein